MQIYMLLLFFTSLMLEGSRMIFCSKISMETSSWFYISVSGLSSEAQKVLKKYSLSGENRLNLSDLFI